MHIHPGAAGVNGPVAIDSGVARTEDVTSGFLPTLQAQINENSSATAIAAFKGLIEDPSQYYLNVHTTVNPGGVMRGQLMRAERMVRLAMLSPANENPPIAGLEASGRGTAVILKTVDSAGNTNSASITFDVAYTGFPSGTEITAMHLHAGPAGVNGPVTIDSTLSTAIAVAANGNGFLRFEAEVDLARARAQETLDSFWYNPSQAYMNVHTRANPGGAIRGQLLSTDEVSFQVSMSPANENPPIPLEVSAPGKVSVFTARGDDGAPIAGAILFDVNPRFGAVPATVFTAMHVHDGIVGVNGPVTLDSRFASVPVLTKDGFGNLFRLNSLLPAAMPSLGSLVKNPELHYANLHSQANPGGVVRSQTAGPNTETPAIYDIIAGASAPSIANIAPGGVASIFGANLSKTSTNIKGVNSSQVPTNLNGTSVTIGGKDAPILLVTPGQLNVQVPFDAPTGMQPVVVSSVNGASPARMHMVAPVAPAILFDATGGIVFKVSDMSLIRPDNAAATGDLVAILCTGLGATLLPGPTGTILPPDPLLPVAVQPTVTIGGRTAPVVGAAVAPGFIGLYGIVASVPPGGTAGQQAVVVRQGTVASNSVNIAVR